MYNVLEKLRRGEPLSAKDKTIHEQGLVSVLRQLHDDLDAAVFDAYGWPRDLTDEQILERLVQLNAERAEEERKGIIRWLRPEFQNPSGTQKATQVDLPGAASMPEAGEAAAGPAQATWPKKLPQQVTAVRELLRGGTAWTVAEACAAFKGAKRKEVETALESLEALGMVTSYEAGKERAWRMTGRGGA